MKKNLTEMVFILDRSGSMHGLEGDTIGGFNSLIEKHKQEPGEALVTTVLFNTRIERLHDRVALNEIAPITANDYQTGGCTALLDAVGSTIEHIEKIHKYIRSEDVPEATVFVITTDGLENASRRYSLEKVKTLIEQHKEKGWEFLFLGANIDAVATAGSMGIHADFAVEYLADSEGTATNFQSVSSAMCCARQSRPISKSWKADIEADYEKRSGK